MEKDLYAILGIPKTATDSEIKRAYRKLAQKHHPDMNKGNAESEQKFKGINVAYEILSDKKKRAQYDQFGIAGGPAGGQGGFEGFSGFDPSNFGGGFSDIFETFFGGGFSGGGRTSKKQGPVPGNDIESVLSLTLEESAFGAEKILEINKSDTCARCKGEGAEPGTQVVTCSECHGTGQVRTVRQTILGQIQAVRTCSKCHGEGRIPEKPCSECHGQMRTRQRSKLTVKIPSGIENGATIRLREKGEAGVKGGRHGDLYLHIQVMPHSEFQRQGYDIYSLVKLHVLEAILGTTLSVKTLHGSMKLKIPSGTQHDQVFKIKNHGVPHIRGEEKGDHYVKVQIETPKRLSRKERELYQEIAKESGLNIDEDGGLLSKLKFGN
ncbi:MAG: molecular chaperone DnaJ [Candidatus Gracilibacteria bacterium]